MKLSTKEEKQQVAAWIGGGHRNELVVLLASLRKLYSGAEVDLSAEELEAAKTLAEEWSLRGAYLEAEKCYAGSKHASALLMLKLASSGSPKGKK